MNRVWAEMLGEGFFTPIDDMGPLREAQYGEVLNALARGFTAELRREVAVPDDRPHRRLPAATRGERGDVAQRSRLLRPPCDSASLQTRSTTS